MQDTQFPNKQIPTVPKEKKRKEKKRNKGFHCLTTDNLLYT